MKKYHQKFISLVLLLLLLLPVSLVFSQGGDLYIFGIVKDYATSKKIPGVTIKAFENGKLVDTYETKVNGKYEFFLDVGKQYELVFSKPGIVTKRVSMDARNIPSEDVGAGFSMNIEMSLFEEMEGLDVSILDQPIGIAKYNANTGALEFDFAYTQKIKDELNRLMREWAAKSKEKEAAAQGEQKELAALDANFNKVIERADAEFLKENYQAAVASYKEALTLKPADPMATNKLAEAEKKLLEKNAALVKEEDYKKAIAAADEYFNKSDYEKAVGKYNEALVIKKDEKYPKDQIAKANDLIAQKKKQMEDDAKFNDLVRKGDNLVKAQDFEAGIENYNQALLVKPKDAEVQKKITDAQKALADYKAKKALDDQYKSIVDAADALFTQEKYVESIAKYEEALKVKKDEQYPKTKIDAAQKIIAELAKKAEEEKLKAETEAKFNELVAKGDADFGKELYSESISFYEQALAIKPNTPALTKKIEEARKKIAEKEQAAALNKQYTDLITNADNLFKADKLTESLAIYQQASGLKPAEEYPKSKIKEINNIIAERARIAEEKRLAEEKRIAEEKRLAEELARFNSLVADGDQRFNLEKYQESIPFYEQALALKPDNQNLPKKIQEAQRLLAQKMAAGELEANYQKTISEADRMFETKFYEDAKKEYEKALSFKPDAAHPKAQIAKIIQLIEDKKKQDEALKLAANKEKEDADRKAKDAALALQREEFNRIVKLGDQFIGEKEYQNAAVRYREALEIFPDDAPALAKLADADRLYNEYLKTRDVDKQYNMILADADAAFKSKLYTNALGKYREALDIKPSEKHPKSRITEIEALLEAQKREEDLAKSKESDEDRRKKLEEEELKRKAELAAKNKALEEEYQTLIAVADKKFNEAEYTIALRNYQEAVNLKPAEYYPKQRIQEIQKILNDDEEKRKEADRLAALEREKEMSKLTKTGGKSRVDTQSEDEAERFMREARMREEAEKWERIKRQKSKFDNFDNGAKDKEESTIRINEQQINALKEQSSKIHESGNLNKDKTARNLENYKRVSEANQLQKIQKENARLIKENERMAQQREHAALLAQEKELLRESKLELTEKEKNELIRLYEKDLQKETKKNKSSYASVIAKQKEQAELIKAYDERQDNLIVDVAQEKKQYSDYNKASLSTEEKFVQIEQQRVLQEKQEQSKLIQERDKVNAETVKQIENQKKFSEDIEASFAQKADERSDKARKELGGIRSIQPKDYDDYYLSKLAQDYPQGVTEESDNHGNKVIIRRIVVQGNKADEYRKVIDKTGHYYFKNGTSISELTWSRETNPDFE
jgi:tetratricopeptide (TPR) repeat protein